MNVEPQGSLLMSGFEIANVARVESEAAEMFRLWPPIGLKRQVTKRVKLTELCTRS